MLVLVLVGICVAAPTRTSIVGTPYLFNEFSYSVDPFRGESLKPAFESNYGVHGENLVASFGNGSPLHRH